MALVPSVITGLMDSAFVAGIAAMEAAAQTNIDNSKELVSETDIKAAGGAAFAAIAGPAIDAYIRSQTLIVPPGQVVLAPPPAGTGATTAPSPPIPVL
jgi:hypothetical protein